jgi:Isopropylmalate/homocitrate/citramalate synthases
MGVQELGLADTIGVANPRQTYALVSLVMDMFPGIPFSLHMHNTRDMALANILAAMQAGATAFDSAVGGLGGCPYVPNATGNIATEDLVNMLHEMGIETGVDLDKVIEAARFAQTLIDHPLAEMMVRAGKRTDLKPAPKEQHKVG